MNTPCFINSKHIKQGDLLCYDNKLVVVNKLCTDNVSWPNMYFIGNEPFNDDKLANFQQQYELDKKKSVVLVRRY
jgi:hypothetical protein